MLAGAAAQVEHDAAGRDAQALFDEGDLFLDLRVADLPAGAHEVFAEELLPPSALLLRFLLLRLARGLEARRGRLTLGRWRWLGVGARRRRRRRRERRRLVR